MQGLFLRLQAHSYLKSGSSHLWKTLFHAVKQLYKNLLLFSVFLANRAADRQGEKTVTWTEEWGLAQQPSTAFKSHCGALTPSSTKLLPARLDQASTWLQLFWLVAEPCSEAMWGHTGKTLVLWLRCVASWKNVPLGLWIPHRQRSRSSLQFGSPSFHPQLQYSSQSKVL